MAPTSKSIDVPRWELEVAFDPVTAARARRQQHQLVDWKGSPMPYPPTENVSAEQVFHDPGQDINIGSLPFRDPRFFVAGGLHGSLHSWEPILALQSPALRQRIDRWLSKGVVVQDFFRPFKGSFKGMEFDSQSPPDMYFHNPASCANYSQMVATTLEERLRSGSLAIWGRVGQVEPPSLVLPFVVEPTKPRLCHDERFLNLLISDNPFSLDTLKEVPLMVEKGSYMTTCDEKAAFDNVLLHESSRRYFGAQFGGWYFVYTTLPFGWKASPFVYQTIGMSVTSFLRHHGVPSLLYIDDHLIGPWSGLGSQSLASYRRAYIATYCVCELLLRLGYTISLEKSLFTPTQVLVFLGMWVDSLRQMFLIPEEKRQKFEVLRADILKMSMVPIRTLQKLMGKCVSFTICVPGAKFYIRAMASAIAKASRNNRLIPVAGPLREEIAHWAFLDSFDDWIPWRDERHITFSLATDASKFAWGAVFGEESFQDYWPATDHRPIHLKEADALLRALEAQSAKIKNHRVKVLVDNMAVVQAWQHEGCKNLNLNSLITKVFKLVTKLNVDLKVIYVKSSENPADAPSRNLSLLDSRLATALWARVQELFGPHTFDLMALDSNCMTGHTGERLRHFTPFSLPGSAGVDVFAQDLHGGENYYVFPPFCLIPPLLRYLLSFQAKHLKCTLVLPRFSVVPHWWPLVQKWAKHIVPLASPGTTGAWCIPTKHGFAPSTVPLPFALCLVRLEF